jgi:hypothetical protein
MSSMEALSAKNNVSAETYIAKARLAFYDWLPMAGDPDKVFSVINKNLKAAGVGYKALDRSGQKSEQEMAISAYLEYHEAWMKKGRNANNKSYTSFCVQKASGGLNNPSPQQLLNFLLSIGSPAHAIKTSDVLRVDSKVKTATKKMKAVEKKNSNLTDTNETKTDMQQKGIPQLKDTPVSSHSVVLKPLGEVLSEIEKLQQASNNKPKATNGVSDATKIPVDDIATQIQSEQRTIFYPQEKTNHEGDLDDERFDYTPEDKPTSEDFSKPPALESLFGQPLPEEIIDKPAAKIPDTKVISDTLEPTSAQTIGDKAAATDNQSEQSVVQDSGAIAPKKKQEEISPEINQEAQARSNKFLKRMRALHQNP